MPSIAASPPRRQLFSVPYNFILYLSENPSTPEVLKKLLKTCKFFAFRNQILVSQWFLYWDNKIGEWTQKRMSATSKLWPTRHMAINSKFVPAMFYRISPKNLHITDVTLPLDDFKMIVAENTIETCVFSNAKIMDATVDFILENLPNVQHFSYHNDEEIWSVTTLRNLNLIQRKQKLEFCYFRILKVFETLSPDLFINFARKNGNDLSKFKFFIDPSLGDLKMELKKAVENYWEEEEENGPRIKISKS